ncbi:MAG: ThuA domain-containing protein [Thermoguttaceae bacterium]
MKRREFGLSCLATCLAAVGGGMNVSCAYSAEEEASEEKKLRILLVVGGHGYDKENLHAMLRDCPNSTFEEITIPEKQDMLKPGLSEKYDVLVFHDQSFFELSDEQKANLEALWGEEGMPTVMLHHSLISHPEYPLFREVFGAQFLLRDTEINGRVYQKSTYLRPTDLNVYIVARKHPITEGVSDFSLNDEVFKNVYFNPHIDVLATTDHPESDMPVLWTWSYKKSPVFGMIQGDAGGAFNDPNYRKLFYQGLRWVVAQKSHAAL